MKKIFIIISVCVFAFANTSVADTIYAQVTADTATIWHKDFHANCGSLYMMDFVMADNHINVYEIDTGGIANCFCYFDLNTVIAALSPGYYTVDVYEKWREYPNDSSFLGSTSFVIEGSMPNVPYLLRNFQSDCFQNVGIEDIAISNEPNPIIEIYPNPVSGIATINMTLAKSDQVEITVFNSMGQTVEKVFGGCPGEGNQKIDWDVSGFIKGIYYLNFKVGDDVFSRKVLIAY